MAFDDVPNDAVPAAAEVAAFTRRLLPKEFWVIEMLDDRRVAAGIWEYPEGYMSWDKIALSDFPNDLISIGDLVRFGITVGRLTIFLVGKILKISGPGIRRV